MTKQERQQEQDRARVERFEWAILCERSAARALYSDEPSDTTRCIMSGRYAEARRLLDEEPTMCEAARVLCGVKSGITWEHKVTESFQHGHMVGRELSTAGDLARCVMLAEAARMLLMDEVAEMHAEYKARRAAAKRG